MFGDLLQDRDTDIISSEHNDIVDNDEPRFMNKDLFNTESGIENRSRCGRVPRSDA